ncbi:hypothetical protein [Subtercola endophyticus]|uniref:hypothetical protein n=1 Tax=Subtercola endophyticus TaxID=2895559 RepID=UPI001E64A0F9|nr:hypothetical protein [Subtercola endophyticus]UFS59282.1 hypothetical protein LQ955_00305 [Subtercola endophyticus]
MTEMITERRGRRKGRLAAVLALVATIGALIVLPATSASALAIDCTYGGPGLYAYIGTGRDGVTCQGIGGGGMGSGIGYHPVTTPGSGQTVPDGYCPAGAIPPVIPDDFYDHGLITSYSYYESDWFRGSYRMPMQVTEFYRNGAFVGSRQVILNRSGIVYKIVFNDSTLLIGGMSGGPGVRLISTGTCSGGWNVEAVPQTSKASELVPAGPMALPGTPSPTPTTNEVVTTGSLTPVPYSSGKYFLRVDATNTNSVDLPTDLDLDLSGYSMVSVAAMPSDGSCPFATNLDEHCSVPSLAPGATKTFTFVVQARTGAGAPAQLNVMTSFPGTAKLIDAYEVMQVSRVSYVVPNTP